VSSLPRFFRLRIRDKSNTSDALTITSVRGGTNPYLSSVPTGDGLEFDPIEGKSRCGAFTGLIADGITSGTDRVVTSQLEDTNFRQQLMDRRAFLEWSADGSTWSGGTNGGVLIAGFLTGLRLADGAQYEYTVSDPTRAEHDFTAFKVQTANVVLSAGALIGATTLAVNALELAMADGTRLGEFACVVSGDYAAGATSLTVSALGFALSSGASAVYSESLASFLARWPNRGCVLGGPVRGGFLTQPDRGGWEMTVEKSNFTFLRFNAGYGPPKFDRTTNPQDVSHSANDKTDPLWRSSWAGDAKIVSLTEANRGAWPGLVCELVGVGFFQPDPGIGYDGNDDARMDSDGRHHLVKDIRARGLYLAGLSTPSAGTKVRVRVFTFEASELSPIYWTGHPADLLAKLWGEAGLLYNAASITTAKNAIGTNRVVSFRITETANLGEWLEANIYGPFGIGVRPNDNGQLEAFAARIPYATAPTTEITSADVSSDDSGAQPQIFGIDQASAIRKVTFTHSRLVRTQDAFDDTTPDGFVTQQEAFERTNGDPGAIGSKVVEFTIDGMVHTLDANNPNAAALADALALELFDRTGRGMITGELQGLRGGSTDTAKLGDEILNKHPYLPNHNKRLSDDPSVSGRAMQIVRSTWAPLGPALKLMDSGPNAQPYATAPTLTIAASTAFPRTVAQVTVTNAATLNADSAGLRLQIAVTTGSTPAASDYTDVAAYGPGAIPTTAISLSSVTAGRKVWVRAAATKVNKRPSTFSSVASVTLSVLPPVTSLSVTPSGTDGSLATAAWTPGDTTSEIDVYLRLTADPASADVRRRTLPPGSNRYVLEGLTPSAAYTCTVQARDSISGDLSAAVTATFTAGATVLSLFAPTNPVGFCGSRDPMTGIPRRDGVFGIAVFSGNVPGFIEAAVAIETSVGAGTYGSFATDGRRVPSVAGDWTIWSDIAPNDGLRRQIKVRATDADGVNVSAYTSVVTVRPWTPLALQSYHATPQGSASGPGDGSWSAFADGPPNTVSWRYAISTSGYPTDATAAAGSVVTGRTFSLSSGSALTFGQTIYITAIAYDGPSGTGAQVAVPSHMQYSFTSFTATKTLTYSAASCISEQSVNFDSGGGVLPWFFDTDGALIGVDGAAGDVTQFIQLLAGIPNGTTGVTLTSIGVTAYDNNPAFVGGFNFGLLRQVTNTSTTLTSGNTTNGAGWQTMTRSLSENTSGGRSYALVLEFIAGSSTANDLRYAGISVTYTMSDPKQAT
jgi:hypothetical protein